MGVFEALAQQLMQGADPNTARSLGLQSEGMQLQAQQNRQRMMMQQQQMAQQQAQVAQQNAMQQREEARQRRMDEISVVDNYISHLHKAETPAGARAVAAAYNGLLPPEKILAGVEAANDFIKKQQEERADNRNIAAYGQGLTSSAPPSQSIPAPAESQAVGGMMQSAPFFPGGAMAGAAMQAPQVIPPQSVLRMGDGQQYYPMPKRQGITNTRQFIQPPGGGNQDPSGELGQLTQAQRLMGVENPQQAAAEIYSSQKGDSMFGIARRALTQFKSPEAARQHLEKNEPMVMGYLKSIADGDIPISGFGEKQNEVRALVSQVVPGFDFTKFHAKQQLADSITDVNSQWNRNVLSLNTLASHLGEFDKRIDALKIGNSPPENAAVLFVRDVLQGDPSVTAADITKEAVINEIERALSGVGATQQGIERVSGIIRKRGIGNDQLKETARSFGHLMDQRLTAIEEQYEARMGKKAAPGIIRYPSAQASLDSLFGKEGATGATPKSGTTSSGLRYRIIE